MQGDEQGYGQGKNEIIRNVKNWLNSAHIDQCLFLMS
jgi:hypothetical protein